MHSARRRRSDPVAWNSLAAFALALGAAPAFAAAPAVDIAVDVTAAGQPVARTMHGLFFEDINYGADGGLYAELVENRSFEHGDAFHSWTETTRGGAAGERRLATRAPIHPNNPRYLQLEVRTAGDGFGVVNDGFDGIPVRAGAGYFARVRARTPSGFDGELVAVLETAAGEVLASAPLGAAPAQWQELEVRLEPSRDEADARLAVLARGTGTVDLDVVSLFPEDTFRSRRNGLRADLAQALAQLRPGFLRFPGGCIVEGRDLANAYRWKDTIGDIAERKQNENLWQDPRSPQYHQTYGLGFFEYFQFAEDLGAEPVPVVNCGMACQARNGPCVPLDELGPWVQDALDLVEFANGPVTSEWGARRAALGHPEPFNLKYLAIGNEQWNQEYFDRYAVFHAALKEKHPEIQLISTSGPFADDALWRFAWEKFRRGTPADLVDEHYYVAPDWLLRNTDRYASYDRAGPKVFVGEFAAHDGARRNTLFGALTEAAYLTGLLRHSDVVVMASYAPLLARYGRAQWQPNLIWFDGTQVVRTPSYHVQALFGQNRPDAVLPTNVSGPGAQREPTAGGRIGLGTWHTPVEFDDLVVTTADGRTLWQEDFSSAAALERWELTEGDWSVRDGVLRQSSEAPNVAAIAGDPAWSDYTLSFRARKTGGREGFLVFFGAGDGALGRWNVGGWQNTQHGLSLPGQPIAFTPGTIEEGRWYDVRIELRGDSVRCYLDGQLVQEGTNPRRPMPAVFAVAGRDERAEELVLHVVNPFSQPVPATVRLQGAEQLAAEARLVVLSGPGADAENTRAAPETVAPATAHRPIPGPVFTHTFPAHSATVLRVPARVPATPAADSPYPASEDERLRELGRRDVRVHDPSTILPEAGAYWMFGTGHGVTAYRSPDLVTWQQGPRVLPELPAWHRDRVPANRGHLWAPDVIRAADGRYLLYYSISSWGRNTSAIGLATARTLDWTAPDAGWTDAGLVVRSSPPDDFNAIDPAIFRDNDGRLWMTFGSFWGGIQLVELDPQTGLRRGGDAPILRVADQEQIEAPFLCRRGDDYYLFVNWGFCCRGVDSTYEIRVGRARTVTGPYLDREGRDLRDGGGTLVLTSEGAFIGPGHPSILEIDGHEHVALHFYDGTQGGRPRLAIRPLTWSEDGWPVIE